MYALYVEEQSLDVNLKSSKLVSNWDQMCYSIIWKKNSELFVTKKFYFNNKCRTRNVLATFISRAIYFVQHDEIRKVNCIAIELNASKL